MEIFNILLIFISIGRINAAGCGTLLSNKIVGGEDTNGMRYPWFALIRSLSLDPQPQCGGALITENYVLSAAHCFGRSYEVGDFIGFDVVLNLYDRCNNQEENREYHQISRIVIHEDFSLKKKFNDISLVTLKNPSQLPIICLPLPGPQITEPGTIIGYGTEKEGYSELPCHLQHANVTKYSIEDCKENTLLPAETFDEPTVFCGGAPGIDTCTGDSGGPFLTKNQKGNFVAAGIVSYAYGCAEDNYPSVFTDVSRFIDWIEEHKTK